MYVCIGALKHFRANRSLHKINVLRNYDRVKTIFLSLSLREHTRSQDIGFQDVMSQYIALDRSNVSRMNYFTRNNSASRIISLFNKSLYTFTNAITISQDLVDSYASRTN